MERGKSSILKGVLGFSLLVTVLVACQSQLTDTLTSLDTPAIEGISLIDAKTNEVITAFETIEDGAVIGLADLPNRELNIRANTFDGVEAVRFGVNDNADYRFERSAPFALAGDRSGDYHAWKYRIGEYKITVRGYADRKGNQPKGDPLVVNFTIVEESGDLPTEPEPVPPEPEPTPDDPTPTPSPSGDTRIIQQYGDDRSSKDNRPILRVDGFRLIAGGLQEGLSLQAFRDETNTVTDPGAFAGWDVLLTPHGRTNATYAIRTAREGTIGIGWLGKIVPAWLNDWTLAGTVATTDRTMRVFTKVLPAGFHEFGSDESNSGPTYVVLAAEADGRPQAVGAYANRECPNSVHAAYEGHWHAKIDPVEWCYYDHEHGSDPSHFGGPALGLLDVTGGGMPHPGYKVMVFDPYTYNGRRLEARMVIHMGTSGAGRRCARFHAYNLSIADANSGDLLISYSYNVDTGAARVIDNPDGSTHLGTYVLAPPECPNQGDGISPHNNGARDLRFHRSDAPGGYEGWKVEIDSNNITGLDGSVQPTVTAPPTVCDWTKNSRGEYVCNLIQTGNDGAQMWIITRGISFDPADAPARGWFCTDVMFREVVSCSEAGAVEQYVAPSLSGEIGIPTRDSASTNSWSVGNPFGGSFSSGFNINSTKWVSPFPAGAN